MRGSGGRSVGLRVIAWLWEEAVDAVRDERGPAAVPGAASPRVQPSSGDFQLNLDQTGRGE